jgi:glycosyltransferase involved in cell wall biosynthesis/quercetin dioxygenase-like cupin family protein
MRIAMISPIAWRTPPRHYGPWENVVSLICEGLVGQGLDVTLFATADSRTKACLKGICARGYEEDPNIVPKVWECLHISEVFEHGDSFDIIHNHFDFLPLTYSHMTETPLLTTIHGFSSPDIVPVFEKYNMDTYYVAISDSDRCKSLDYIATVHHGIDTSQFTYRSGKGDYLLFFGRIHPEKGTAECIEVAKRTGLRLVIAGIIQDDRYFEQQVRPHIDGTHIIYVGPADPKKRDVLLGEAYALLHPISFDEPFGLSIVEAMACGTPVIAYDRGSMREIIDEGRTGFIVDDIDRMVEAVPEVGKLDRADCRQQVEARFRKERMVLDYIRAYKEVLKRHEGKRDMGWGASRVLSDKKGITVKRMSLFPKNTIKGRNSRGWRLHWYVLGGRAFVEATGRKMELFNGSSVDIGPDEGDYIIENRSSERFTFLEVTRSPEGQAGGNRK